MTPREEFAEGLAKYRQMQTVDWPATVAQQEQMEAEILERFSNANAGCVPLLRLPPLGSITSATDVMAVRLRWEVIRRSAKSFMSEEDLTALEEGYAERLKTIASAHNAKRKILRAELRALAARLVPQPGSSWTKVYDIHMSAFAAQTAKEAYARVAAELRALSFMSAGLDSEVRYRPAKNAPPDIYEVWVKADLLDVEITRYAHGLPLDEWIEEVLARGMNPRVLWPDLPWGTEERLGIYRGTMEPTKVLFVEVSP